MTRTNLVPLVHFDYPGFDRVLPLVVYLVSSSEFPDRWTGERDPFRASAGDVFHGAFCYSVIKGMSVRDGLEFSCVMAALNCTKLGARGEIATETEARALIATAQRRVWSEAGRI